MYIANAHVQIVKNGFIFINLVRHHLIDAIYIIIWRKQQVFSSFMHVLISFTEMLTIPIFAESYRFARPISALLFPTSKLRQITILKWYQIK